MYMFITIEQNKSLKQNIQKNRLNIKELLERKIGDKKQNRLIPNRIQCSFEGSGWQDASKAINYWLLD